RWHRRGHWRPASGRGPGPPARPLRSSPGRAARREWKDQPLCGPLVLSVERGDVELLGLLGLVRVLGAGIDAQVLHLAAAKRPARDHALDGLLEHALRKAAFQDVARGALLDAAGM